ESLREPSHQSELLLARALEAPSFYMVTHCLLLLVFVCRGSRDVAVGRRAGIGDANTVAGILELHSKVQRVLLEEIDDLVERLLAEVLDLENLRFSHLDEIAKRADAGVLE